MKFKVGDLVQRPTEIDTLGIGKVIKAYSKQAKKYCYGYGTPLVLGPYPELYDIKWENGLISKGYLPHGIIKWENNHDN